MTSQFGADATTISWDGSLPGSVVRFASGESPSSVLEGFTITGGVGEFDPGTGHDGGGGIFITGSSPTVRECILTGNLGDAGGAVYGNQSAARFQSCSIRNNGDFSSLAAGFFFTAGAPQLLDCEIRDNSGFEAGGGAFFDAFPLMNGCTVADNGGCVAPGLWLNGCPGGTIRKSHIVGNSGLDPDGGGLNVWNSTITMSDCIVSDNAILDDHSGGGIHLLNSNLTFVRGRIERNFAGLGGGVYADANSMATIEDSWIADNVAEATGLAFFTGRGGGVFGPSALTRCLLVRNRAIGVGGGSGAAVWGAVDLASCTLYANTADTLALDCGPTLANCIVWQDAPLPPCPGTSISYSDVEGGHPGVGNIALDPLFVDPGNDDFRLQAFSPCIDAGDPSLSDPDGTIIDMGAIPFAVASCAEPTFYCTAKVNSLGCTPFLTTSGTASLGGPGIEIRAHAVLGATPGFFFFGIAPASNSFFGGTLCAQPPIARTGVQFSGGAGKTSCTGSYEFLFDASVAAAFSLPTGTAVHGQFWSRDNGFAPPNNIGLTNATRFVLCN